MFERFRMLAIAAIVTACVSTPAKTTQFDESKRLPLPCKAESKPVAGRWYVNIDRNLEPPPGQPAKFATGSFDARVTVWVTFEHGQQLITLKVKAAEDGASVESGEVSTGRMITGERIVSVDDPVKCEAFAAAPVLGDLSPSEAVEPGVPFDRSVSPSSQGTIDAGLRELIEVMRRCSGALWPSRPDRRADGFRGSIIINVRRSNRSTLLAIAGNSA